MQNKRAGELSPVLIFAYLPRKGLYFVLMGILSTSPVKSILGANLRVVGLCARLQYPIPLQVVVEYRTDFVA